MINLIFSKLIKNILFYFLVFSLSLTLIVWAIQAVNFLEFVSEDGHSFKIYIYYTLLSIPKIFSRILPLVFFISIFYTLTKYEGNNELVIFWSNGINKIEFINHLIKLSIVVTIFQIFLTTVVTPITQDLARSHIRSSNIEFFPSLIKEKEFIDTVENLTIYIEEKSENKYYKNIFLKDDFSNKEYQIIYAKNGEINITQNILILFDGQIINKSKNKLTNFNFKKTNFDLSKYSTKSTITPKIQEWNSLKLFKCVYLSLKKNESNLEFCKSVSNIEYLREAFRRVISPLFIPTIILFSSFVIIKSKHDFKYNFFNSFLFLMCIFTVVISELFTRYIGPNEYINLLFYLSPIIMYFLVYSIFYRKIFPNVN